MSLDESRSSASSRNKEKESDSHRSSGGGGNSRSRSSRHDDDYYDRDRRYRGDHRSNRSRYDDRDSSRYTSSSSHKTYDADRGDSRRRQRDRDRHRGRSRSASYGSKGYKSRSHRDSRSSSYDKRRSRKRSHSPPTPPRTKQFRILRASRSRSKSKTPQPSSSSNPSSKSSSSLFNTSMFRDNPQQNIIPSNDEEFDKEKIHKEMQERLTLHLAREGKVYPPPKPQAQHPIFANDGSFLETFKKLQQHQQQQQQHQHHFQHQIETDKYVDAERKMSQPMFSKRRGGKILKTGIVQKPKLMENGEEAPPAQNDAWAIYLQEVNKYKNASCDADSKTRPLVK